MLRITSVLIIICILLCLSRQASNISSQIQFPRYNQNKISLNEYVSQKNKVNAFKFPQINFQISSKFYLDNRVLQQSQLYDKQSYYNDIGQFCTLYPTSIQYLGKDKLQYQIQYQPLKYFLYDSPNVDSTLFILMSNSYLYQYSITQTQLNLLTNYSVPEQISKIKDQQLSQNIQLIVVQGVVMIVNKNALYSLNQLIGTFYKVPGFEATTDRLVDVGVYKKSTKSGDVTGSMIWVCQGTNIKLYEVKLEKNNISVRKTDQKLGFSQQPILSIYLDRKTNYFYATTSRNLLIYSFQVQAAKRVVTTYQVDGNCRQVNKIKQALFLSCSYQHIPFIAEYRAEKQKVVLNRYYDESKVEGLRKVTTLGYDKMVIIGDEEATIIGEAINRNQLLELYDDDQTEQLQYYFYSFGMLELLYLPQYSTYDKSVSLSVGIDGIQIVVIFYSPPELDCNFGSAASDSISLLAVFNTTHCPYARQDPNTQGGTYLFCQTYYPFKIDLNALEYEQKTSKFIFFVVLVILIVALMLCAGCGFKIRNKYNSLAQSITKKIQKIKKMREDSQLKKL